MAVRRLKGAERERTVVAAAASLMSEQGLADLRMTDVAERAGMSVGHLTYYFPSKSALLVSAITMSEREFQADVDSALLQQDDPWARFHTLLELAAARGPRDRGWLLWFEVWASAGTDEGVAAAQRELEGWWRQSMRQIVVDGVESGRFTCDDVDGAVAILSALTDGLSVRLTLDGESLTRGQLLEHVTGVAMHLLGVGDR